MRIISIALFKFKKIKIKKKLNQRERERKAIKNEFGLEVLFESISDC